MEESGKVIKAKNKVKTSKKQVKKKSNLSTDDRSVNDDGSDRLSRPGTANTLESKVEELFQVILILLIHVVYILYLDDPHTLKNVGKVNNCCSQPC